MEHTYITIDLAKHIGRIKPMNCVNNGPVWKKSDDQNITNLPEYKDARIPYARTHDSSIEYKFGGEHTVDVIAVFPNFDADPGLPQSYDFQLTDDYLHCIELAGTKVFYRLGCKIEHWSKKYGTLPPKDFHKWAVICEHIIRHYCEGWANGFHMDIEYWEIWNEADGSPDDCPPERKLTWSGTAAQFYDFFIIAAAYLKEKFPLLKIGGPAVSWFNEEWLRPLFDLMTKGGKRVPLDFFSWHCYFTDPRPVEETVRKVRAFLDSYGYTETESILDEWNYIKSFSADQFLESIKTEISMKGAAFEAATMCAFQDQPLDMLMYYDARPCVMNGIFDFYTKKPLKGYYPLHVWGELLALGCEVKTHIDSRDIYSVTASDKTRSTTLLCYYTDNENQPEEQIELAFLGSSETTCTVAVLDESQSFNEIMPCCFENGKVSIILQPNTVVVVRTGE